MMAEPPEGSDAKWLTDWVTARSAAPADQITVFTSVPLLANAPKDVPLTPETERVTLLWWSERDPLDDWAAYQQFATDLAAAGGQVVFAAPFIKTLPGTDTYTDQLW
jgi:hypothetical protein